MFNQLTEIMKKRMLKPIAAVVVASFTIFGCARHDRGMDTTASESATMSETETMAGDDVYTDDAMDTRTDDMDVAGMSMTDEESYNDMFNAIDDTKQHDILDLATQSSNLSTFARLIEVANLGAALRTEGPFTIFAPTNEAFAELPGGKLEYLMQPENREELVNILQAHVLPARVLSSQFTSAQRIGTPDGKQILIDTDQARGVTIGGAPIVRANVEASNGIIHVVNRIVTPTDMTGVDGVR
jgi:uncharacterized surface protein with fasciclin (FAS1) repeats